MDADGEDEMANVKRKIEAMEVGSEERRVGVNEWRRLKRIPQQSAEYGVVRNYVSAFLLWPGGRFAFIEERLIDDCLQPTAGMADIPSVALILAY